MQRYLTRVSKSGLDMPTMLNLEQFLPVDAPLLDYLVHDTRRLEGWKYPKLEDLESGELSVQPRVEPGDAEGDRGERAGLRCELGGGDCCNP